MKIACLLPPVEILTRNKSLPSTDLPILLSEAISLDDVIHFTYLRQTFWRHVPLVNYLKASALPCNSLIRLIVSPVHSRAQTVAWFWVSSWCRLFSCIFSLVSIVLSLGSLSLRPNVNLLLIKIHFICTVPADRSCFREKRKHFMRCVDQLRGLNLWSRQFL